MSSNRIAAFEVVAGDDARLWDVAGCRTLYTEDTGTYAMAVPRWCKNGRCEIFGEWGGNAIGALGPGFTWAVNFIQYAQEGNYWVGGPDVNIAGASLGGGSGTNGDGFVEWILGPYMTADGSYFGLLDDSWRENRPGKVSFELWHANPGARQIDYAKIYICRA